ncbi:MAG: anaerobic ribonucleoside-triphosphate reductase activating protein [Clostridia bacterium]|nr:anaerobic ribonucleoside-triphosphate reductase activating protein [Clostridia bacterium]
MKIHGLQKLTLLDFPGQLACTIFTAGCNMRCPFCHNASLVTHIDPDAVMDEEEFFKFLKKREGVLDGVAITGGEPTIVPDLIPFIGKIRALGYKVKLDTNGTNPEVLRTVLRDKLVDYVAMDIKNSKENYPKTVGIPNFKIDNIELSANILMSSDTPFEFRTTVVNEFHSPSDFESIGKWLAGNELFFLQNFKDSGDLISEGVHGKSPEQMNDCLAAIKPFIPKAKLRGV